MRYWSVWFSPSFEGGGAFHQDLGWWMTLLPISIIIFIRHHHHPIMGKVNELKWTTQFRWRPLTNRFWVESGLASWEMIHIHRNYAVLRVLCYHLRNYFGIDEAPVVLYALENIESWWRMFKSGFTDFFKLISLMLFNSTPHQKTTNIIKFSVPGEITVAAREWKFLGVKTYSKLFQKSGYSYELLWNCEAVVFQYSFMKIVFFHENS